MVYTRFKCDRLWVFAPKYLSNDYAFSASVNIATFVMCWKYFSYTSEATEKKYAWRAGYPQFRDPIAKRNEKKYKSLIKDNDIDICDPKWTGVEKAALPQISN